MAVAPGDYYVGVNINSSPKSDAPFPPTYYPGVTNKKDASVVSVGLGKVRELELRIDEVAKPRSVHFVAIRLRRETNEGYLCAVGRPAPPGDAASYVNVDLGHDGVGTLHRLRGLHIPPSREPLGQLWKRLVFKTSSNQSRNRSSRGAIRYGPQRGQLQYRRDRSTEEIAPAKLASPICCRIQTPPTFRLPPPSGNSPRLHAPATSSICAKLSYSC